MAFFSSVLYVVVFQGFRDFFFRYGAKLGGVVGIFGIETLETPQKTCSLAGSLGSLGGGEGGQNGPFRAVLRSKKGHILSHTGHITQQLPRFSVFMNFFL